MLESSIAPIATPTPRREVTRALPPFSYKIPNTISEIMDAAGGSFAGHSAVSLYLSCPERSRLRSMGVERRRREKPHDESGIPDELADDPLVWGTILHALRASRLVIGHEQVMQLIARLDVCETDRIKLANMWLTYNANFPLEQEPFRYLGVEVEVISNVAPEGAKEALRSVRYDSVIVVPDTEGRWAVFSLEAKSASRSGQFNEYMPQFMFQTMIWNANPHLVEQYGPMRGVVIDALIKTQVPKAERIGPKYIPKMMQQRALEYARLPEQIHYPLGPDGAFPRMLHACWGRYRPCEYIGLCHEDARGDYTVRGEEIA